MRVQSGLGQVVFAVSGVCSYIRVWVRVYKATSNMLSLRFHVIVSIAVSVCAWTTITLTIMVIHR